MAGRPRLVGKVCLVTGATRGIGKGIALQLGEAGATVYISGRTLKKSSGDFGSLEDTAKEIEDRGGRCIPVQCDHSKDDDVQRLFDRIKDEQNGQLDVLVNNAYSAVMEIIKYLKVPFWDQPASMWDEVNNVGLRNHYICAVHAARLMVPRRQGLIVNISSTGGLRYALNVAYGIGKEASDRMAADCAVELRRHDVAFISLWPGPVQTELMMDVLPTMNHPLKDAFIAPESLEFTGIGVVHLATDPNVMKKTGRIWCTSDLSDEYGFTDINGERPTSFRSVSDMLAMRQSWLAHLFPRWVRVPGWVLALIGSKL